MKIAAKAATILVSIALIILPIAGCSGSQRTTNPSGSSSSIVSVIAVLQQAIVRIDVTLASGGASGSGSIIDKRGYVLTNYHVIDGALTIQVTLMNVGVFQGTLVASDKNRDLALVKITSTRNDFPIITFGQKFDIQVGVDVYAIGFPMGTGLSGPPTVTRGIVSAQRVLSDGYKYIQTDATINPGNSGGCLFIANGNMIGMPSAGIATLSLDDIENIGVAVPIDDILLFVQKNLPS
jgi:serine protease Do